MARIPNGNFSITFFQRWHKNYGDGYKVLLDGKSK